jgi:broad specificity phosphatase PhoE
MTRLFFVRHADAYDENGIQLDDYSLNNFGKLQALQLAKRLKNNKFQAMYCSKIKRSIETCEAVNEIHKMEVVYTSALNEVGTDLWPQPGIQAKPQGMDDFNEAVTIIYEAYKKIVKRHRGQEVIVFTHGNWIRVLLSKILNPQNPQDAFAHFLIHNTSLNIVDVNDDDYEYIISVSDAAHTHLYESHI